MDGLPSFIKPYQSFHIRIASACGISLDSSDRAFHKVCRSFLSLIRDFDFKENPEAVEHLHLFLASHGLDTVSFFTDHLIRIFAASNNLNGALQVFTRVQKPSLYTWNAIISASVMLDTPDTPFSLYQSLLQSLLQPDRVMLLSLLKVCDVPQSMLLHHHVINHGLDSDPVLASALASVHTKYGAFREAYRMFKQMKKRDVVSWGTLMTGYLKHGYFFGVFELFEEMRLEGVDPDRVIIICILKACSHVRAMTEGRSIHNEVLRAGLETDLAIGNILIDMYGRYGSVEEAYRILIRLKSRDSVSWSALLTGYAAHGYDVLVFESFKEMVDDGLEPSKVTYLCVLKACINLASLAQCRLIHEQIIINAYDADLEIGNSLVDFYSKCELPEEAYSVFRRLTKCDIVTWGALVAGYAQIGADSSVFDLLSEMSSYGFMPNNIIFTSILSACSCAGRIKQAQMYFKEMVLSYKVMPSVENYSCLIDLFGRVGSLEEAQRFFEVLPLHPDTVIWKSLLTSCRTHGSINLGQLCFGQAAGLDTEDAT